MHVRKRYTCGQSLIHKKVHDPYYGTLGIPVRSICVNDLHCTHPPTSTYWRSAACSWQTTCEYCLKSHVCAYHVVKCSDL